MYPKCSSWFCNLDALGDVIPMRETEVYVRDLFGLKTLDKAGKISFHSVDGGHLKLEGSEERIYKLIL